jgi:cytochrome c peroxidase
MNAAVLVCALLLLPLAQGREETPLDERLAQHVSQFRLRPLTAPRARHPQLFSLGQKLFFDKNLSGNKNISCADCHHPLTFTSDRLPLALGEGARGIETRPGGRVQAQGSIGARHSLALFNLHQVPVMFWDGRVSFNPTTGEFKTPAPLPPGFSLVLENALSAQALFPLINHDEMRGKKGSNPIADAPSAEAAWELILQRILQVPQYRAQLQEIFPAQKLTIAHVARAIGHFEEIAFFAADTAYDRYLKGDKMALTPLQKKGMDVFFDKGQCGRCHRGEHLSDFSMHNIGVPQFGPGITAGDDRGRFELDPRPAMLYGFRVPPLRNVAVTAPYMHNGAFLTLMEVIEHYDDVVGSLENYSLPDWHLNYPQGLGPLRVETNPQRLRSLSPKLSVKLFFTEEEEEALMEFLSTALTHRQFLPPQNRGD